MDWPLYMPESSAFYDRPISWRSARDLISPTFPLAAWQVDTGDYWTTYWPPNLRMIRDQGWKVHISARIEDRQYAIDVAADIANRYMVPFKHLADTRIYAAMNAKDASRHASGKLVTIYPGDSETTLILLTEMTELLRDAAGPYILSDLRWKVPCLYLRYGSYAPLLTASANGELVPAIRRPDGTLVEDDRSRFRVPDWVPTETWIENEMELLRKSAHADFPYANVVALHFSNSGGVYRARSQRTGRDVVLKEGRPYAGLDAAGDDGRTRVQREASTLAELRGLSLVPDLIGTFQAFEHEFLEEEFVPGRTLAQIRAAEHPLLRHGATLSELRSYQENVEHIVDSIREGLREIHAAGWVYADLHSKNVLVTEAGDVRLVDFEAAYQALKPHRTGLAHPAYARTDATGSDLDLRSLDRLRLAMLCPAAETAAFGPEVVERMTAWTKDVFEGDRPSLSWRNPRGVSAPERCRSDKGELLAAVLALATPERADRLYAGDPNQFAHSPSGFAHGAAGVIWVLAAAKIPVPDTHVDWLVRATEADCERGARIGLYDGIGGAAVALQSLGRHDEATAFAKEIAQRVLIKPAHVGWSLHSGVAGIACVLAGFGDEVAEVAEACGRDLVALVEADALSTPSLMWGWAGLVIALCVLSDSLSRPDFLISAQRAADRAISQMYRLADGSLTVRDGARLLPYLASGSVGVWLALRELELRTGDRPPASDAIWESLAVDYVVQPQLFNGRAGILAALASAPEDCRGADYELMVGNHLDSLRLERESVDGHALHRGEQMHRFSLDFATGNAGVAHVMTTLVDDAVSLLPYLSPRSKA